jgi:hypothetical protein
LQGLPLQIINLKGIKAYRDKFVVLAGLAPANPKNIAPANPKNIALANPKNIAPANPKNIALANPKNNCPCKS